MIFYLFISCHWLLLLVVFVIIQGDVVGLRNPTNSDCGILHANPVGMYDFTFEICRNLHCRVVDFGDFDFESQAGKTMN